MRTQREHHAGRAATTANGIGSAGGPLDERVHGRGTAINPASRFESITLAQLPVGGGDDDLIHEVIEHAGGSASAPIDLPRRRIETRYFRDRTRSIINAVDSPDLNFKWTINPYRGCEHGCIYCYARPTHEYLGLSSGLDFETRIYCKTGAPDLLRAELAHPDWRGEPIMLSGITDAYQPIERHLRITRGCLEVMNACGQPLTIVTKSALVLRDIDILADMASRDAAKVAISLTTLDARLSATMEPRAASPKERLRAIRELSQAGVRVVVMTAPIIPGVNDMELPALLQAAAAAGAKGAGYVLLRLPWQNKGIFEEWLAREFPLRAGKVEALVRGTRGGRLYNAAWGSRMRGEGEVAAQIGRTFEIFARRYGLNSEVAPLSSRGFVKPAPPLERGQLGLFDDAAGAHARR